MGVANAKTWKQGSPINIRRMVVLSASTTTFDPPLDGIRADEDLTVTFTLTGDTSTAVTLNMPAGEKIGAEINTVTDISGVGHGLYLH